LKSEPGKAGSAPVTRAEKMEDGAPSSKPADSESIYYQRNFAQARKIIRRL
jgi:hypothetical protein